MSKEELKRVKVSSILYLVVTLAFCVFIIADHWYVGFAVLPLPVFMIVRGFYTYHKEASKEREAVKHGNTEV